MKNIQFCLMGDGPASGTGLQSLYSFLRACICINLKTQSPSPGYATSFLTTLYLFTDHQEPWDLLYSPQTAPQASPGLRTLAIVHGTRFQKHRLHPVCRVVLTLWEGSLISTAFRYYLDAVLISICASPLTSVESTFSRATWL